MFRSTGPMLKIGSALGLLFSVAACGDGMSQAAPGEFALLGNDAADPGSPYGLLNGQDWSDPIPQQALPMSAEGEGDYGLAPIYDYRNDAPAYYDGPSYQGPPAYSNGQTYQSASYDGGGYYDGGDYDGAGYDSQPYWDDYRPSSYYDDGGYIDNPQSDSFGWLAMAAALTSVLGNSPPDYYFDYGRVQPWVWETGGHYRRYAEPIGPGYRYYFYEPGAARPFLVRDPFYSYGYRDGRVMVVYDRYGRVLDRRHAAKRYRAANYYYDRAGDLYGYSTRRNHRGVSATRWIERRSWIERDEHQWVRSREKRTQWRKWDDRHDDVIAARWSGERAARRYAANRFDGWRKEGLRGDAPRFYREASRQPRVQRVVQQQKTQRQRVERLIRANRDERRIATRQNADIRIVENKRNLAERQDRKVASFWSGRNQPAKLQQTRVSREEARPQNRAEAIARIKAADKRDDRAKAVQRQAAKRTQVDIAASKRAQAQAEKRTAQQTRAKALQRQSQALALKQQQASQRAQAQAKRQADKRAEQAKAAKRQADQRQAQKRAEQAQKQAQAKAQQAQRAAAQKQQAAQRAQANAQRRQAENRARQQKQAAAARRPGQQQAAQRGNGKDSGWRNR